MKAGYRIGVASARVIEGDSRTALREFDAETFQTCITSPPYYNLRDYGHIGQVGSEAVVGDYVDTLARIFREVWEVLRDDGTLWLNLGDTMYHAQLLGIPWRVAFALKDDGWLLRSEVIWHKRNGLPDGSATDRPDRFHEQIFLFTKRRGYYYDAKAIREESDPDQEAHNRRYAKEYAATTERAPGRQPGNVNHVGIHSRPGVGGRNKRSVWTCSVQPFPGVHTATFPPKLIEPCILAGSRPGDVVLDPFSGAGTAGLVALRHDRDYIGVELNPEYAELSRRRIADDAPLLNEVAA